jgi:hypothetical protein
MTQYAACFPPHPVRTHRFLENFPEKTPNLTATALGQGIKTAILRATAQCSGRTSPEGQFWSEF